MARRSLSERNIRKLITTGGGRSYILTLPIEYVREMGWEEGQLLDVKKFGKGVKINEYNPDKKGKK